MKWISLGSIFMFIAVMMGAFGAHALKGKFSDSLMVIFETGVRYQVYHAIGLLAVGFLSQQFHSTSLQVAGWSFVLGIVVFSGSLYAYVFTSIRTFGAITPIGGLSFLIGWGALAIAAFRK